MMIRVIYLDGSAGEVETTDLTALIKKKKIVAFCRSGEWARVGRDPVRKRNKEFAGFGQRLDDMNVEGDEMQKLIVQKGTRYEIRADEIAPGLYRLSTCVARSLFRGNNSLGNGGEPPGPKGSSPSRKPARTR